MSALPLLSEDEVRSACAGIDEERRSFGHLATDRGVLPLVALDIVGRIVGTFAHTTVVQRFVNATGVPVEATYIFPLPDRAAVCRFSMEVAGRRVEGLLEERGKARETYDRALAAGQRAALAEEERPGTFSLRVGNLMPGEEAAITLELTGPLPVVDGEVTFRFPLVVAPRYIPGNLRSGPQSGLGTAGDTDAVPDASRISPPVLLPGFPNPVALTIAVSIDPMGLPLSDVRSALHAAWAEGEAGLLRVRTAPGERLDRDFVLRFRLGDGAVRTAARATDDTFLVTLLPPLGGAVGRPRDLVFVLDRSGSMGGWKMVAARRAVARMIEALRPSDRFAVLAFDDRVDPFAPGLTSASDAQKFRATEWLAHVDARGGTEMAQPLSQAASLLGTALERDRVLVFVTDGQVGNESQLVKLLGQRLKGARVFALGIDPAVNAGFLNRLAALGGQGEAELVESEARVEEVLARCHRRIDTPILRDLTVVGEGCALRDLAPARLPDVFAGVPAVIAGRFTRAADPVLIVRGTTASGAAFEERVRVERTANRALLPAWARLHLRDLEDRFDAGLGDRAALERQIVATSLEAKVLCRFTAFVAVDPEVVNRGGVLHRVVQAVEEPAWEVHAMQAPAGPPPAPRAAPAAAGAMPMRAKAKAASPSLLARAAKAVFGAPRPMLAVYADRIRALAERLERGEDISEDLRLLLEELAHDGVAPAEREPLADALEALAGGDRIEALRLLRAALTP